MNATNYYVSTTRLVLQAEPDSPASWQHLYTALPTLRNSLSCTVCESLLSEPYTPEETSCEHHVCKSCKGGVKKLRPTCSWCKDYSKYSENVQLRILIQNYKKLCGLIKITRMFGHILRNPEQGPLLRDIILESEGAPIPRPIPVQHLRPAVEAQEVEVKREPEELAGHQLPEPDDEIISSPFSLLKSKPSSSVASLHVGAAKAALDGRFGEAHPTPKSSPAPSPPSASPPAGPAGRPVGGIRKIKAEAFILNPRKGKADLPHIRKLESAAKALKPVVSETSPSQPKQMLLSDYGISSSPKVTRQDPEGSAKRKLGGCRCGNATLCPGKLTCCGQRCPCYVDNLACTDCKCKGCRNPHRPGGGKKRPSLPYASNMQVVYPVARDQPATVRIPVGLAGPETVHLKGIDLSQLPVLNLDSSPPPAGSPRLQAVSLLSLLRNGGKAP